MVADLSQMELVVEESGFDDLANPTSFTITIKNNNPDRDDNNNFVFIDWALTYDLEADMDVAEQTGYGGGEKKSTTLSWDESLIDGAFAVGVGAIGINLYDNGDYIGGPDLTTDLPFGKTFRTTRGGLVTDCSVQESVPPGDSFEVSATLSNDTNYSYPVRTQFTAGEATVTRTIEVGQFNTTTATVEFFTSENDTPGTEYDVEVQEKWFEDPDYANVP